MAVVTCLIGLQFGHVIVHFKVSHLCPLSGRAGEINYFISRSDELNCYAPSLQDHKDRILRWMMPSFCLLAVAFSMDFFGMESVDGSLYSAESFSALLPRLSCCPRSLQECT